MRPLSAPALAASSALGTVGSWNALFLPLGTMQFSGQYFTEWARVMAFVVIVIISAMAFCLLAERYIVARPTGGAAKG